MTHIALSPSEQRIVSALIAGATQKEIALAYRISPKTAESHITNARRKLEDSGYLLVRSYVLKEITR